MNGEDQYELDALLLSYRAEWHHATRRKVVDLNQARRYWGRGDSEPRILPAGSAVRVQMRDQLDDPD